MCHYSKLYKTYKTLFEKYYLHKIPTPAKTDSKRYSLITKQTISNTKETNELESDTGNSKLYVIRQKFIKNYTGGIVIASVINSSVKLEIVFVVGGKNRKQY